MKGLFIWANSYCRSTLGFFQGLGKAFDCPLKIVVLKELSEVRKKTGFCGSEFDDLNITLYEGMDSADKLFDKYKGWNHIFGSYQSNESVQLIKLAISKGIRFGICSEAPCNMEPYPIHILKDLYLHFVLPRKVRPIVDAADFIVNFSGDDDKYLLTNGWSRNKIIPCGYYSPRIANSQNIRRTEANWKKFNILLSGIHQWHRSPMLLLYALKMLKDKGLYPECIITQEGPLLGAMKAYVARHNLDNVHFLGFVSIDKLVSLYEGCTVYVGAGNYEPWGMRLNDVLQCGAPMIINKGMGGVKFIKDYSCGLAFGRNDANGLASAIKTMMTEKEKYLTYADNAYLAATEITPEKYSTNIANKIMNKYQGWK